jgi:hypothetical protein
MRLTDKAKRTLIKYFGEEKTQRILEEAVIGYNRLDMKKVEDILNLANFYTGFWEDYLPKNYTKQCEKDFEYIYDLLICNESPFKNNIKLVYKVEENEKLKFKIINGENNETNI